MAAKKDNKAQIEVEFFTLREMLSTLLRENNRDNIKQPPKSRRFSISFNDGTCLKNLRSIDFARDLYNLLFNVFLTNKSYEEMHDVFFDSNGFARDLSDNIIDECLKDIRKTSKLCCITSKNNKSFDSAKNPEFSNLRQGTNNTFVIIYRDEEGKMVKSVADVLEAYENEPEKLSKINKNAMYIKSEGMKMIVDILDLIYRLNQKVHGEDNENQELVNRFEQFLDTKINIDVVDTIQEKTASEVQEDAEAIKNELSLFSKEINEKNRQVIFTGAPGTGKTYGIREYIKKMVSQDEDRYKFIQFHSSYDYTDFVEGIRPVSDGKNNIFVRMDGTFKEFCRAIVNNSLDRLENSGLLNVSDDMSRIDSLYELCKERQGESNEAKEIRKSIKNKIMEKPYYFIIDEINRADVGKVFGELMFGLEQDYRGVENRFATQYANMETYEVNEDGEPEALDKMDDVFLKGFFIPENLYIIGTMNDIDRSVESFDFALRRRFHWVEVRADRESTEKTLRAMFKKKANQLSEDSIEELINMIDALNNCIKTEGKRFGLSEAFFLGAAYFKDYGFQDYQVIWDNKIQPILKEYTRGRDIDQVSSFIRLCAEKFYGCKVSEEYKSKS